jgi:hypothetical protein
VVAQLYVDNRPALLEARLNALVRRAATGGEQLERIAAGWEGMGRNVVPGLQPLYASTDDALRFYAARTGLRLGDLTALPVLAGIAAAPSSAHRIAAINDLALSDSPQVGPSLAPLLSDTDSAVRIAAYEALIQRGHPAIRAVKFPHILDRDQINFILDIIDAQGPPLIYARRTRLPRLAVFGTGLPVTAPVFYVHSDDSLTVHTTDGADDLHIFAKQGGRMSEELTLPPRVPDLVTALADLPVRDEKGRLRGLGLPYARVLQVLAALNRDQTIPGEMVLEDLGPVRPVVPEVTPERPIAEPAETGK